MELRTAVLSERTDCVFSTITFVSDVRKTNVVAMMRIMMIMVLVCLCVCICIWLG